MNRLGIAIVVTSNGMGDPVVANHGGWTRHVGDIRPVLGRMTPPCGRGANPLIYMTFSADGTYIAVARAVSGRLGDNVAGWIYIPDGIAVDGEDISDAVSRLARIIEADRIPGEAELESEFARCFAPVSGVSHTFASDPCGPLAWRGLGTYGLESLAGTFRRQSCYARYCGVVLARCGQTVAGAVDLSDCPLDDCGGDTSDYDEPDNNEPAVEPVLQPAMRFGLCRQWQPYAVGAVAGFLLGMIVAWAAGCSFGRRPAVACGQVDTAIVQVDTVAQPHYTAFQLAEAVAYLDSHKVWNRADMDSLAPLNGLWDALNRCSLDAVAIYRVRLDGSAALKVMADTLALFGPDVLRGDSLNSKDNPDISIENYGQRIAAAREAINNRK